MYHILPQLKPLLGILAALFGVIAFYPYLRDILKKRTKPHVYTWLIWTITQGTAVFALWHGNGGWGAWGLTIGAFLVFATFLISLKYGTKNITRSDTALLVVALAAVFVWWQLDNPILAVLIASAIDGIGYIPTFRKAYTEPQTETISSWVLFSIGNIFALLALDSYNVLTVAYLITITIGNLLVVGICLLRKKQN